jgi:hypothetical protein
VFVLLVLFGKDVPRRISVLLRGLKSIKIMGAAEIELNEATARLVASEVHEVVSQYRNEIMDEVVPKVRSVQLEERLANVFNNDIKPHIVGDTSRVRCTIHVPDLLFTDSLYQLIDYYPGGGGCGRAWDVRSGIIGRVWRSQKHEIQGNVLTERSALIREWSMTGKEADSRGNGRHSFAAVLLCEADGTPVCVFYMDHIGENAFGADSGEEHLVQKSTTIKQAIVVGCSQCGIVGAVSKLMHDLKEMGPYIKVYD